MRPILIPVALATAYLFVYSYMVFANIYLWIALWMFVFSPAVVLWMVYKILKNGIPSTRTFDDYFYEDMELQPVPVRLLHEDKSA